MQNAIGNYSPVLKDGQDQTPVMVFFIGTGDPKDRLKSVEKIVEGDSELEVIILDYKYHSLDPEGHRFDVPKDELPSEERLQDDIRKMHSMVLNNADLSYHARPWHVYGVSLGAHAALRFVEVAIQEQTVQRIVSIALDCPFKTLQNSIRHVAYQKKGPGLGGIASAALYIEKGLVGSTFDNAGILRKIRLDTHGKQIPIIGFSAKYDNTCNPSDTDYLCEIGSEHAHAVIEYEQLHARCNQGTFSSIMTSFEPKLSAIGNPELRLFDGQYINTSHHRYLEYDIISKRWLHMILQFL